MDETSKYKRQNDFIRETYDRISLIVPKGQKEVIKKAAQDAGMSVNQFIYMAIEEKMMKQE